MKSPILILFVIINLIAVNLVMANNMYVNGTQDTHQHASEDTGDNTTYDSVIAKCVDEHSCTHVCHISAHLVGFINQISLISPNHNSISISTENDALYSLILDQLPEPPKA